MSRELTTREIVVELLETYTQALYGLERDSLDAGVLSRPGAKVLWDGNPRLLWAQGSYVDLDAALQCLRAQEPRLYWHVRQRFISAPTRIVVGCPECRQATDVKHVHVVRGKHMRFEPQRISVKCVSGAVVESVVQRGVDWIVDWFGSHRLSPWLPREVFEALAA